MRKVLLRLVVACTTFFLSLGLTNISAGLRTVDSSASAVQPKSHATDTGFDEDEQLLLEIYREYGPAQTRHDRAFFERLETDDFILFSGAEHLSREQDIRQMEKSPADSVYDSDVEYVKIFGDTAVARGRMEVRYGNGETQSWGFIDVWVRRGHDWQIQSTTSGD